MTAQPTWLHDRVLEDLSLDPVEQAIRDIAAGRPVVVVDDEDRENEGDLVIAAEKATPEIIAFMMSECRGLICAPMEDDELERLELPQMVTHNTESMKTAFTVSVDASTEQSIKLALREAMAGRTTFIIAHRLSTIALAEEIVVLEAGELIARGSHDELLELSDLYREIVEKGLPDQVFLTRKPVEREVAGL